MGILVKSEDPGEIPQHATCGISSGSALFAKINTIIRDWST